MKRFIYKWRSKRNIRLLSASAVLCLVEVEQARKDLRITAFQHKAYSAACHAADCTALAYLSHKNLPFYRIRCPRNDGPIISAYWFLCAVELYRLIIIASNSDEYRNAFDVTVDKLISGFASIFATVFPNGNCEAFAKDLEERLSSLFESFDKNVVAYEEAEFGVRDLFGNQAIRFGKVLAEGAFEINAMAARDNLRLLKLTTVIAVSNKELFDRCSAR